MYIKYVKIKNFRGIKNAHLNFGKGTFILIGPSNVGKSTILTSIDMVLNPSISWWRRDVLSELDFYRFDKKKAISVEILIGCGRLKCIDEANGNCPYFEFQTNSKSTLCKFAENEKFISWDNELKKFLKADDLDEIEKMEVGRIENTVRVQLLAEYQESEGFVETKHMILNEDEEEWAPFTQSLKEWIGARLLASDGNPSSEIKIQYNSLLTKSISNIPEWKKICGTAFRKALKPTVEELKNSYAKNVVDELDKRIRNLDRIRDSKISIGVVGANENDIVRQIELCREFSKNEDDNGGENELPFSRQGKGFQNISSLVLGAYAAKENSNSPSGFSIILLEDPEKNLTPQLQRGSMKDVKHICGENSQIIITTHSPYIISPLLKLEGVKLIRKTKQDEMEMVNLDFVIGGKNTFFNLRKRVPNELELFEALFSTLVVLWEGECEAGFYQTLMRQKKDFPAEMLAGLNAGGSECKHLALWLKNAGYEVLAVLDGDNKTILNDLDSSEVPFIALPPNKKIEDLIVEQLENLDEDKVIMGLISCIGSTGKISPNNKYVNTWPALNKILIETGDSQKPVDTEIVNCEFEKLIEQDDSTLFPSNLKAFIQIFKRKLIYQEFAAFLRENDSVPPICEKIVLMLKDYWFKERELKQLQFCESGEIQEYSSEQ